jgi:hypothetical protein
MRTSNASDLALIVGMVNRASAYLIPPAGNSLARAEAAALAAEAVSTALQQALRAGITSSPQEPGFAKDLEAMREKIIDEAEAILSFGDDEDDYPVEIETVEVVGTWRIWTLNGEIIREGDTVSLPPSIARALSGRGHVIIKQRNTETPKG